MVSYILYFFLWTFILYWIHRLIHITPILRKIHFDHHRYVALNEIRWHWSNMFLFTDTWISMLDLWITEVIPTIIFSIITGQYWILIFYYLWAAFIQERVEHNNRIRIPFVTSGKWHLLHHKIPRRNFGLFFTFWDIIFFTNKDTNDIYFGK